MKNSKNPKHPSKNLTIINNDRIHGVIFRLKADMAVLLIIGLNGSGIVNKRYYHVSIGGIKATTISPFFAVLQELTKI